MIREKIQAHGNFTATFVGKDWSAAPDPAKTLHRLLVEAVKGNPIVETQITPGQQSDNVAVTIAAKY